MARQLIKGAGFIEKGGSNYAGSTQDEANIGEVLAGRAHWQDDAPEAAAPAAPSAPTAPTAPPGGGGEGGGGGTSASLQGLAAAAAPAETPAIHEAAQGPYLYRPGLGQRQPPSLAALLTGMRY